MDRSTLERRADALLTSSLEESTRRNYLSWWHTDTTSTNVAWSILYQRDFSARLSSEYRNLVYLVSPRFAIACMRIPVELQFDYQLEYRLDYRLDYD